jgi:hypothetical protein
MQTTLRAFLVSSVVLLGCAKHQAAPPPPADAVKAPVIELPKDRELDQTRALMWKLARQVRLLGFVTDEPDRAATDARAELQAMEEIAQAIAALPERSNHPILDDNIGGLIKDIRRAEAEVAGASPEWGTTNSITTACVRCHELRTCPFDSYKECVDVPVY